MSRRRDDPTRMPTSLAELEAFCDHVGDCWLWPAAVSGGAPEMRLPRVLPRQPGIYGCVVKVPRAAWEEAHGRPLQAGLVIWRCCHEEACVNPKHLRAVARGSMAKLMAKAGRLKRRPDQIERMRATRIQAGHCKLDPQKVVEIRTLQGGAEHPEVIGKRYGVSESTVRYIWSGRLWGGVVYTPKTEAGAPARRAAPTVFDWAQAGGRF